MDRQLARQTEERPVLIKEVNTSTGVILAQDQFGTDIQISLHFNDPLLAIPAVGEKWLVKRKGIDWFLEKKQSDQIMTTISSLSPGDQRIDASNKLYLHGSLGVELEGAVTATSGVTVTGGLTTDTISISGGGTLSIDTLIASGGTDTTAAIRGYGVDTLAYSFGARVTADTTSRWAVRSDGRVEFGDGTNARDTFLYRSAAAMLKTDGAMTIQGADGSGVGLYLGTGFLNVTRTSAGQNLIQAFLSGEANPRFYSQMDGTLHWGAGGASAVDTNLYRFNNVNGGLATDKRMIFNNSLASTSQVWVGQDASGNLTPGIIFGSDAYLYRYASAVLRTSGALTVDGALSVGGATTLGGSITLPNGSYLYGKDTGGTPRPLIDLGGDNYLYVGRDAAILGFLLGIGQVWNFLHSTGNVALAIDPNYGGGGKPGLVIYNSAGSTLGRIYTDGANVHIADAAFSHEILIGSAGITFPGNSLGAGGAQNFTATPLYSLDTGSYAPSVGSYGRLGVASITIPRAGAWLIRYQIGGLDIGGNYSFTMSIGKNGAAWAYAPSKTAVGADYEFTYVASLSANDVITTWINANHSGTASFIYLEAIQVA